MKNLHTLKIKQGVAIDTEVEVEVEAEADV